MSANPERKSEAGHLMVVLMVMLTFMAILSGIAVQEWTQVQRRDNEAEMMFRAQEIVRAIQRYNTKSGGKPLLELKQLMEELDGQYLLRKMYTDPLVPDGKWGLLYTGPDGSIYDPNSAAGTAFLVGDEAPLEGVGGLPGDLSGGTQEATGLPIIGVRTMCKEKPFRVYKGLNDYSKWLFTTRDLQGQGTGNTAPPNP